MLESVILEAIQDKVDFLKSDLLELFCENKIITETIKNELAEMGKKDYNPGLYNFRIFDKTEIQLTNRGMLVILGKYNAHTLLDVSISTNYDFNKMMEIDNPIFRNFINNIFSIIHNQYKIVSAESA